MSRWVYVASSGHNEAAEDRYVVGMHDTTDGAPESRQLATLLRNRRLLMRLTQEDVADLAGISRQTYNKYESGRTPNPKPRELRAVCRALQLDPREIVVALGFVTRSELELPPAVAPLDSALVEPASLLADEKIPEPAKARLREYLVESVVFWKRRAGFQDLREPSASDRATGKPITRGPSSDGATGKPISRG